MATEEEPLEEVKSGGGGKLMLIVMLVNTLGLVGLAAFVVLGGLGNGASPEAKAGEIASAPVEDPKAEPEAPPGPVIELGVITVNLRDPGGQKYLKARVQLQIDTEESRPEVEGRLSQIRYQIIHLLAGMKEADVKGSEPIEVVRKRMLRRANAAMSKGKIVNLWPDEWVVQ